MSFRNDQVPPDRLPDWRRVELSAVSPRYASYRVLSAASRWLVVVIVLWIIGRFAAMPLPGGNVSLIAVAVLGALGTILAGIEARRRGWALRQHDLIYQSGLLVRRTVVLPFRRVQHVETLNGPLERAFGLLRLTCYTAGGLSADLVVAGLETETAERVRQYLLGRIGDEEERPDLPEARLAGGSDGG